VKSTYSGRVANFDDVVGRGEIEARGGMRFPFHCTAIADGTRSIAPDTEVKFRLVPGPLGALEATAVTAPLLTGTD
jgi:cold shock CspA family protein